MPSQINDVLPDKQSLIQDRLPCCHEGLQMSIISALTSTTQELHIFQARPPLPTITSVTQSVQYHFCLQCNTLNATISRLWHRDLVLCDEHTISEQKSIWALLTEAVLVFLTCYHLEVPGLEVQMGQRSLLDWTQLPRAHQLKLDHTACVRETSLP